VLQCVKWIFKRIKVGSLFDTNVGALLFSPTRSPVWRRPTMAVPAKHQSTSGTGLITGHAALNPLFSFLCFVYRRCRRITLLLS